MSVLKHFGRAFLLFFVLTSFVFQAGCTVVGIRTIEEAPYTLVREDASITLRDYDQLVLVETHVDADYAEAGNIAFKRLFAYILGENRSRTKIAMTAPVFADEMRTTGGSENIAMTMPVLSEQRGQHWRYAFVLPASYSVETAPVPTNAEVRVSVVPRKQVAVIRYSGSWSEHTMREKREALGKWIAANNLEPLTSARSARYDPPWTISFLRRNEVMIDVK
jgi:hypothetical protein